MLTTQFFDSLIALGGTEGTQVVAKKPSFFARLIEALKLSRQREADRVIRRYAAMHGYDADRIGRNDLPF